MVFYRKYRPQTIDELDSANVCQTLSAVFKNENIPHAFLFTGPKGLGKTSTARIVAKVVNCTKRKKGDYNPCNTCDACISITNGNNIDVLEIDGASNRGIDEIRDLREKVRLAPSSLKKKVYIIDEVHMLTTEAFNALLKTIEEPPEHVMFLFCTTEPHKVPATIVSRCFHIPFERATDAEIVRSLERIVAGEKLNIDKNVLPEIAKLADGGFRDAAKILEEVTLISNDRKIEKSFFEATYKFENTNKLVLDLLNCLSDKNLENSFEIINKLTIQGIDIKFFVSQLLNSVHILLLKKVRVETSKNVLLDTIATKFDLNQIDELVDYLSKAYNDLKYSVVPQLPLEIAVIKWCSSKEPLNSEIIQTSPSPSGSQPSLHTLRKHAQNVKVQSILNPVKPEQKKVEENKHEQRQLPPNPAHHDTQTSLLENIIYKTKPHNHSVAAVLRGSKIKIFDNKELVLETAYKFHKERLDEKKTKEILTKVVKEITGKEVEIKVELKTR